MINLLNMSSMTGPSNHHYQIVFADAFTTNSGDVDFSKLAHLGNFQSFDYLEDDQLKTIGETIDILIVNKFKVNDTTLPFLHNLKYIVVAATGYNNIDADAVKKRKIPVSNVRGYSTASVVQHVFSSLLTVLNRIHYYDHEVKKGRWKNHRDFCFYDHSIHELAGKNFGIIGFGNIGRQVAAVANAFGMKVFVYSRTYPEKIEQYVHWCTLEELLCQSDIVSLHAPLTDETKHIISMSSLRKMKQNAILINTGRGDLIFEDDLITALDKGIIQYAILDVLCTEPPVDDNKLLSHSKTLITPHIAWASLEARKKLIDGIAANIVSFYNGEIINRVY